MAKWFRVLDFNAVSWVQIMLWPLAGVVLGKCLVQLHGHPCKLSQLVCIPPVGILNYVIFICSIYFIVPEKPLLGSGQLSIYYYYYYEY